MLLNLRDSTVEDNATKAAKYHNEKWLHVTRDGKLSNLIVYGKILGNNQSIELYSDKSFENWKEYN